MDGSVVIIQTSLLIAVLGVLIKTAFQVGGISERFKRVETLVKMHGRILSKHYPDVESEDTE